MTVDTVIFGILLVVFLLGILGGIQTIRGKQPTFHKGKPLYGRWVSQRPVLAGTIGIIMSVIALGILVYTAIMGLWTL